MNFKVRRYVQMELSAEVEADSKEEAEEISWDDDSLNWQVGREDILHVAVEVG